MEIYMKYIKILIISLLCVSVTAWSSQKENVFCRDTNIHKTCSSLVGNVYNEKIHGKPKDLINHCALGYTEAEEEDNDEQCKKMLGYIYIIRNKIDAQLILPEIAILLAAESGKNIGSRTHTYGDIMQSLTRRRILLEFLPQFPTRWILVNAQGLSDIAQDQGFTKKLEDYGRIALTILGAHKKITDVLGIEDLSYMVMGYYSSCSPQDIKDISDILKEKLTSFNSKQTSTPKSKDQKSKKPTQ
jgi:hypothetical protein